MFDQVVVVDWSASSRPARGRDSIWIAEADAGSGGVITSNPRTRSEACAHVEQLARRRGRMLIGVDFSLGYPAGTAAALGLDGVPWRSMWNLIDALVVDGDDNSNNRFEVAAELNRRISGAPGPFWGCPPSRRSPFLGSDKVPPGAFGEWRLVELRLRRAGHRPFSAWQLLGAGSVGGQSLLGIARLCRLVTALADAGRTVRVWPFESGPASLSSADVVIAEVWPTLYPLPDLNGAVRDEVQVIETARRLLEHVDFNIPGTPPDDARSVVENEEGWVVGA